MDSVRPLKENCAVVHVIAIIPASQVHFQANKNAVLAGGSWGVELTGIASPSSLKLRDCEARTQSPGSFFPHRDYSLG